MDLAEVFASDPADADDYFSRNDRKRAGHIIIVIVVAAVYRDADVIRSDVSGFSARQRISVDVGINVYYRRHSVRQPVYHRVAFGAVVFKLLLDPNGFFVYRSGIDPDPDIEYRRIADDVVIGLFFVERHAHQVLAGCPGHRLRREIVSGVGKRRNVIGKHYLPRQSFRYTGYGGRVPFAVVNVFPTVVHWFTVGIDVVDVVFDVHVPGGYDLFESQVARIVVIFHRYPDQVFAHVYGLASLPGYAAVNRIRHGVAFRISQAAVGAQEGFRDLHVIFDVQFPVHIFVI